MSFSRSVRVLTLPTLAVVALAGCGDALGVDGRAHVKVLLTDAPSDYIGEALVDIGLVELLPAGDGDRVTLSEDGTDGPVNLLDLQGAATTALADAEIEAGSYREIRLIVESARVTLADGYEFRDGSTEAGLTVPSGAQSGIKLKLRQASGEDPGPDPDAEEPDEAGVEISGERVLVLDFDVGRSFRIQGNPMTPAGISGVHFQPTLRVVVEDAAGSISGTVSTALDGVSVEGLVVTAEPVDEDGAFGEYQTRVATAVTAADGSYTIFFVVPGRYEVTVGTPDGLGTNPAGAEVEVGASEDVTDVDFSVVSG